ncbi:MAG: hypothetical protein JKY65_01295 [Planctomycetes bacterium]|nr:hypothetical protein [Planctomycetota bacterium]
MPSLSRRPLSLFLVGFMTCAALVASTGAKEDEKDPLDALRTEMITTSRTALQSHQTRARDGASDADAVMLWTRIVTASEVEAGQKTSLEAAEAVLSAAKRLEGDAKKRVAMGVATQADLAAASYFRARAELDLALLKKAQRKGKR